MLGENFGVIPVGKYPQLAFLTAAVAGGIPLRAWEKIRFSKQIKQTKVESPVFIIGYYRSGTTFLHYLLGCDSRFAFPDTYQVMLPNIFLSGGSRFRSIIQNALPETRPMDNLKMGAGMPKEEEFALLNTCGASLAKGYVFPKKLIEYNDRYVLFENGKSNEERWKTGLDLFLKKVSVANGGKRLIVKTPANTARIKQLLELYPDARFIHIHRNPFYVYHSNMKMLNKIVGMMALTSFTEKQLSEFLLHSYASVYDKFNETKSLIPAGQFAEVQYETFVQNPLLHLADIYSKLNLGDFKDAKPALEKELESYKNYETNKFELDEVSEKLVKERWGRFL